MEYVKNLGVYVGKFDENDLKNNIDKQAVEQAKEKYKLEYTNTKIVKEKGITYLKIWICNAEDFKI
jgi:hypothetical protein